LVAVAVGIIYTIVTAGNPQWGISSAQLVGIPEDIANLSFVTLPNFAAITNPEVWIIAFTIALVASLETLLCVEATDKLDPDKRETPKNRELLAQGIGNILSGMIGGLPVTQVIVRSSANIQSGGKTKAAAVLHGIFLVLSVLTIPFVLNKIPLSVLAAILLLVGYKLAKPVLFVSMYKLGWKQFIPFIITVVGIIAIDLLVGIGLGVVAGILFLLIDNYRNSHSVTVKSNDKGSNHLTLKLAEEVTFINKAPISKELERIEIKTKVEIDITKTKYIDNDIIEIIDDFLKTSQEKEIQTKFITENGIAENPDSLQSVLERVEA
jgi:MFS superfamily sulfate permease-like transporter